MSCKPSLWNCPTRFSRRCGGRRMISRREMRLAAAMLWYSRGMVSQEKGAQIAGINRAKFLEALAANKIDVFVVDFQDLQRELDRG